MANGAQAIANSPVEVFRLEGSDVADNWEIYGPWIMATMEHDLEPVDAVECMQRLRGNNYLCLQASQDGRPIAIIIAELTFLPNGRSFNVKAMAGEDFENWMQPMWSAVRVAAISQGCARVYFKGRMGWKKRLRRLGFKSKSITMEYKLNG